MESKISLGFFFTYKTMKIINFQKEIKRFGEILYFLQIIKVKPLNIYKDVSCPIDDKESIYVG